MCERLVGVVWTPSWCFGAIGLKPAEGGGVRLAFSIANEVQIYRTTPADLWPPYHGQYAPVPCGGAYLFSTMFPLTSEKDISDLRQRLHPFPFVGFPGTHFFPLQTPTEAAELLLFVLSESSN